MNGRIYIIKSNNNENIYVGSTTIPLIDRWRTHKNDYKKYNNKLYNYIRENGGIENWYIELYEEICVNNKEELRTKEREIIQLIGTLNKNNPISTQEEKRNYQKQYHKQYQKVYYETHKEQIKQRMDAYCEREKEQIANRRRERNKKKSLLLLEANDNGCI